MLLRPFSIASVMGASGCVGREALRHQAASIAASLSAKPHLWEQFRAQLIDEDPTRPMLRARLRSAGRQSGDRRASAESVAACGRHSTGSAVGRSRLSRRIPCGRWVGLSRIWKRCFEGPGLLGYAGGILLFVMLSILWAGGTSALIIWLPNTIRIAAEIFVIFSLLALRDLLRHGWNVERAADRGDLEGARIAIAKLVGRDTARMDLAACRRAAIESISENLTDGFISPIFWYAIAGLPGLVLFKVVSTMDSMVGYKTPRYLRFGWCGARTDDLMNWVPARLTWLLLSAVASALPGYSGRKSMRVGWRQHAIVPGPNSGWSEAAAAGAIERN